MAQVKLKAGATLSLTGTVTSLTTGLAWTAACTVRNGALAIIANLTTTLAEASDYSTSGNWVLTLYASSSVTAQWLDPATPFDTTTLYADVAYSVSGQADPVAPSDTFAILVTPLLTGA